MVVMYTSFLSLVQTSIFAVLAVPPLIITGIVCGVLLQVYRQRAKQSTTTAPATHSEPHHSATSKRTEEVEEFHEYEEINPNNESGTHKTINVEVGNNVVYRATAIRPESNIAYNTAIPAIEPESNIAYNMATGIKPESNIAYNMAAAIEPESNITCNMATAIKPEKNNIAYNTATATEPEGNVACNIAMATKPESRAAYRTAVELKNSVACKKVAYS